MASGSQSRDCYREDGTSHMCSLQGLQKKPPTPAMPSPQVMEIPQQNAVKYTLISKLSPQRLPGAPVFCLPLARKEWGLPTRRLMQFIKTFTALRHFHKHLLYWGKKKSQILLKPVIKQPGDSEAAPIQVRPVWQNTTWERRPHNRKIPRIKGNIATGGKMKRNCYWKFQLRHSSTETI